MRSTATKSVQLIEPETIYTDYLKQLDLRLSRRFSVGRMRLRTNASLYNVFNTDWVSSVNTTFSTVASNAFMRPTGVLQDGCSRLGCAGVLTLGGEPSQFTACKFLISNCKLPPPPSFDFHLRTRIVFGDGAFERLGRSRELRMPARAARRRPGHRRAGLRRRRGRRFESCRRRRDGLSRLRRQSRLRMVEAGRTWPRRRRRLDRGAWRRQLARLRKGHQLRPGGRRDDARLPRLSARRAARFCRRSGFRRRREPAARRRATRSSPTRKRTRRWPAAIRGLRSEWPSSIRR